MKQYQAKITDEALADMERIYNYIARQLLEPEPWHSMEMRRMNVDHYSVFYVIRQDTVYVTDVLYSASDIENRLRGI